MAKDTSMVKVQREELIRAIKEVTGLELKRSKTATAGLAVSNKDMRANALAHLLCNAGNFQTVGWILQNWKAFNEGAYIPKQFADMADCVSVGYACGTAPRFVLAFNAASKSKVDRHKSKDAAKTGRPQEFIAWAQSWRMTATQSMWVGTSRSVKNGVANSPIEVKMPDGIAQITGSMDGYFMERYIKDDVLEAECTTVPPQDEVLQAIESQRKLAGLLAEGGIATAKRLSAAKDFASAADAAIERMKAKKLAEANKPAKPEVAKPEMAEKPATAKKPRGKSGAKAA